MVANPDKFQVTFMALEKGQKVSLEINGQPIKTTEEVKLLGITIDSKLQFRNHVEGICKEAIQLVKAFSSIAATPHIQDFCHDKLAMHCTVLYCFHYDR